MPSSTIKKDATLTSTNDKKRVEVVVNEKPKFFLHLDADRDGKVDDNPQDLDKWEWGRGKKGAAILVNNNSSAKTGFVDHDDTAVNGAADCKDLAPLDIRRKGPPPPASWKASLSVSTSDAQHIRVFDLRTGSGTEVIGPSKGNKYELPTLDFEKLEMGIEAIRYAGQYGGTTFNGAVTLSLAISGDSETKQEHKAIVRVAPWIMFNHFDKPEKVFVMATADNSGFVAALSSATASSAVPLEKVAGSSWGGDRWMQDIMEFGYSELPGQIAARNVLETPRGRQLAGMPKTLLGEAMGYVKPVPAPPQGSSSLNSGGNLECTPPFTSPEGKQYPFGRMYFCKNRALSPGDKLADGYREFLAAQVVQQPIEIDAGWLSVGHVDEIISFVPAKNKLGFKLLLASPKLGMQILEANRTTRMLLGRTYVEGVAAEMLVSDLLKSGIDWKYTPTAQDRADYGTNTPELAELVKASSYKLTAASFIGFNRECQGRIDLAEKKFSKALGLGSNDIGYVPALYIHPQNKALGADALTAGMVNMLVLGQECIAPRPFGPLVGGVDMFEDSYRNTLKECGLNVAFVDDWHTYHLLKGEVHCGSNTLRHPDAKKKWWEFEP